MMPGETHSAAPGTAADLSRCQGCASLQQNLNEYVEALITLKQKIINTDNLLTEYQKKCDELQFARRENSTLHHQVEQMLQKISPLQKCQEELGSLKAELEEKKSSLKLYQDTHQEYARVKEECLKTDAQKKKLEAKVKKLEEAAVKQTQDFKQLRNEKKILEKEFKKTQERLDEFSKQKNEKELRHIGTQISSDSYGSIDKRRVKLLLKELWLCINTTHRLPGEGSRCVPEKPAIENPASREPGEDGVPSPVGAGPPGTSAVQTCLAELSMEIEGDFPTWQRVGRERPGTAAFHGDHVFNEDRNPEVSVRKEDNGSAAICDHSHSFDDDLQAAVDFFKLPPPLLSPVPSPPLAAFAHLGPLPSSLAPETYFGECTDSSDNDWSQHRNSAETVSEDDTPESQNYFGSTINKSKGNDAQEEMLTSQEATQALSTLEGNGVMTVGFGTFTATFREPLTTYSLASEKHWPLSSKFTGDGETDLLKEAKRQTEDWEMDESAQTEKTLHKPLGNVCAKLSGSQAQEEGMAPRKSYWCYSPLGKRPFSELMEAEGKVLLSKMMGSPRSEFTKWTLTNEITSESGHRSIPDHFQGIIRELEKKREDTQGFTLGESPEPEEHAGDSADAAGPGEDARLSSSSTSGALSSCSNRQASSGLKCSADARIPSKGGLTELRHSEQQLQAHTLNTFDPQSEPPECSAGHGDLETSLPALTPELEASDLSDQGSSEAKSADVVKGVTQVRSLPQSIFMKAVKDVQCGSQDPRIELIRSQSDATLSVSVESQSGLIRSDFGFSKSTLWDRSDLIRRGGEERLSAKSDHEPKTDHQLQKSTPFLGDRGSVSKRELTGKNNPMRLKAAVSPLPNQVSVITKQARPESTPSTQSEPWRLRRGEPASVAEHGGNGAGPASAPAGGGEKEGSSWEREGVAAMKRTSPEVSTLWGKLDFSFPGDSLPVENCHHPTNRKLTFPSEHIPAQSQAAVTDAVVHEQSLNLPTKPDSSRMDTGKRPAAGEPVTRALPVGDVPCGDTVRAGGETLAISEDSPSVQQSPRGPLDLPSQTPGGASAGPGSAGTAFSSAIGRQDGEPPALPQSSLPGSLCCYTGIREVVGGDPEGEDSEVPSCSEGENEPEAGTGHLLRRASGKWSGAPGTGAAEGAPSLEVGSLTSALQDFNISALSEMDRLSTSEVVMFLESCQLRDSSSGDSVSECSSKGTLNKEFNKELKQSEIPGEKYRKQLCEETLETSEEWLESEEDDCPLRARPLTPCSLETLSEVLTKIGRELQTSAEDSDGKDAGDLLLLNTQDSMTAQHVLPDEAAGSLSHSTAPAPPPTGADAEGSSPAKGPHNGDNTQGPPEGYLSASNPGDGREEALSELAECLPHCTDSEACQMAENGAGGEAETTFQCQISTVTSEVINVLINKDQNLVIEKGDNWTIINGVALVPNVDQVILCDASEDTPASPGGGRLGADFLSVTSVDKSPESSHAGPAFQEPLGGSNLPCLQEDISGSVQSTNFDKSRLRNRPVKPSVRISSEIYDQNFDSQIVASDHTYYNSKLEPFGKNKNRSKISNKDQTNKLIRAVASTRVETNQSEVSQAASGERGNTKSQRSQTHTILATADTSTPTDCSADTLSKIRQEVGPPLPPLLAPLVATPPRTSQPVSPLIATSSSPSPTSPGGQISPLCHLPVPPVMSPLLEEPGCASPPCTSPSPSAALASERMLSSPLQFCAATPKHALPVPGRLPPFASAPAAVAGPQENSVKILDTMYPELSARARTLNILKGNIQLPRGPAADCRSLPGPASAVTGLKALTSASTAFVKTGGSSGGDCSRDASRDFSTQQDSGGKRLLSVPTLRSAKRLRLDGGSPDLGPGGATAAGVSRSPQQGLPEAQGTRTEEDRGPAGTVSAATRLPPDPGDAAEPPGRAIADALRRVAESPFDLLPVIRSHVYVGNISKKPVMRDQEKEVVYEFSTTKKHLAECLLHSILSELEVQRPCLEHSYAHALCRVYVGICRQLGDLERARLFCYSLLKEDFPESEKLTLFIANMWHDVFLSQSVINKAMQLVARQRAKGEVRSCLRAFLNWEKNAPVDVGFMVSKLLLTIQLCPKTEFQPSEKFGEDLSDTTWEYIFAIDLLCCHQKWIWTHDNIISKELWPVMDRWIKYRKGHANIAYTPDIIIASVLRLIGRLGQLGLKEGFPSAVKNISSVIGMFIQHAQNEDIPWGVQLAAVYALCDLSPSNPSEISKILEAWHRETAHSVPSAVVSYLEEVRSLCAEELG
nr:little elongation complex subunit 1 isoform X1 [Manis javanica]XP_036871307.1 little elongation complex subunit 1 isoform X1 [Manis javanica]